MPLTIYGADYDFNLIYGDVPYKTWVKGTNIEILEFGAYVDGNGDLQGTVISSDADGNALGITIDTYGNCQWENLQFGEYAMFMNIRSAGWEDFIGHRHIIHGFPQWAPDEILTGDGTSGPYTLTYTPVTNSLQLWFMGRTYMTQGGNYTISGKNITLVNVPKNGTPNTMDSDEVMLAKYQFLGGARRDT